MMGYPVAFWLAVGVASGAGAVVLVGIGWLWGRASAARAVAQLRDDVERACSARHSFVREWGGW